MTAIVLYCCHPEELDHQQKKGCVAKLMSITTSAPCKWLLAARLLSRVAADSLIPRVGGKWTQRMETRNWLGIYVYVYVYVYV